MNEVENTTVERPTTHTMIMKKAKFILKRKARSLRYDLTGFNSRYADDRRGLTDFREFGLLMFGRTPLTVEQREELVEFLSTTDEWEQIIPHRGVGGSMLAMSVPRMDRSANGDVRVELPTLIGEDEQPVETVAPALAKRHTRTVDAGHIQPALVLRGDTPVQPTRKLILPSRSR